MEMGCGVWVLTKGGSLVEGSPIAMTLFRIKDAYNF
jgi:hypothetical protein